MTHASVNINGYVPTGYGRAVDKQLDKDFASEQRAKDELSKLMEEGM